MGCTQREDEEEECGIERERERKRKGIWDVWSAQYECGIGRETNGIYEGNEEIGRKELWYTHLNQTRGKRNQKERNHHPVKNPGGHESNPVRRDHASK